MSICSGNTYLWQKTVVEKVDAKKTLNLELILNIKTCFELEI